MPIGILASLFLCTLSMSRWRRSYAAWSPTRTSIRMRPSPRHFAAARRMGGAVLHYSAGLIAAGALAGMTSVLLITFLSQARIFLAMARDGLMPHTVFGAVHEKFKTPHVSTIVTGAVMAVIAGFTPISLLEEMVNIGTLFAFIVVCAAVLILRIKRPEAPAPSAALRSSLSPRSASSSICSSWASCHSTPGCGSSFGLASAWSSTSRTVTASASCEASK